MEMTMHDVSLDIESCGVVAGYAVLNIGAVYFDRHSGLLGKRLDLSLDVQDLEAQGYGFDPRTREWWEGQPDGVREHCWAGILPVDDALRRLAEFMEDLRAGQGNLWVKGEHMDVAMLEFMYDRAGQTVPWMYRAPKDLRTYELALEDAHKDTNFFIPHEGPAHTGLGDAIYQARWVMAACHALGGN